jgi:hypothetical protein
MVFFPSSPNSDPSIAMPISSNRINTATLAEGQFDLAEGSHAVQFLRQVQVSDFIHYLKLIVEVLSLGTLSESDRLLLWH